jgi:hypothetical protein
MTDRDPPRIGDPGAGDSEPLARLLREARADVGSDTVVKALHGVLAASLWPDGGPPGSGNTPPGAESAPQTGGAIGGTPAGTSALALKAGIGALLVAAAVGTWLSTQSEPAPPPPSSQSAPARETEPTSPGINPGRTEYDMGAAQPGILQPESSASSDNSGIIAVAPSAPSSAPPSAPQARKTPETAPSESALLGQAQAALSRNASLALSLSEQHRAWYPRGMLVQEREVIAIEALKRLGRQAEAGARAARFLKAFPSSAHRSKIESLVPPR